MITDIDQDGIMTIKPETPLEAYALKKWCADALTDEGTTSTAKLLINTALEQGGKQ